MRRKRKRKYSGLGGQAVIEGIMMRNDSLYSVAVLKPDNQIETVVKEVPGAKAKWIRKIPFIRGVFQFADSLSLGMDALSISADYYAQDEPETGFDKLLTKIFGKYAEKLVSVFSIIIAIIFAIGLFFVLPVFISEWISKLVCNHSVLTIIEGLVRLTIMLSYLYIVSLFKDIKRTYMYHGAEHKCINCLESGKPLTVKNVSRASRKHKRCGTSFITIIALITIVLFFFIKVDSLYLKLLIRIAMIPVIAGISYELLRYAGKHNNVFVKLISAPGMWIQNITTKEPTSEMIEVSIKAVEAVYDWKQFLRDNFDYVFEEDENGWEEEGVDSRFQGDLSNTVSISKDELNKVITENTASKDATDKPVAAFADEIDDMDIIDLDNDTETDSTVEPMQNVATVDVSNNQDRPMTILEKILSGCDANDTDGLENENAVIEADNNNSAISNENSLDAADKESGEMKTDMENEMQEEIEVMFDVSHEEKEYSDDNVSNKDNEELFKTSIDANEEELIDASVEAVKEEKEEVKDTLKDDTNQAEEAIIENSEETVSESKAGSKSEINSKKKTTKKKSGKKKKRK